MGRHPLALLSILVLGMTATAALAGERKDVPDKYKWNLADLYPSEEAWTKAKEGISHRIPELAQHRGKLGKSPATLLAALQLMFDIDRDLSRLAVYASSMSDEDIRAPRPREMKQAAEGRATGSSSACCRIRPERLAAGAAAVHGSL